MFHHAEHLMAKYALRAHIILINISDWNVSCCMIFVYKNTRGSVKRAHKLFSKSCPGYVATHNHQAISGNPVPRHGKDHQGNTI